MAEIELSVCAGDKLDCKSGSEILLWLNDPTKLVINIGQVVEDYRRLISGVMVSESFCQGVYTYVIEYDETLLVDPLDLLDSDDIRRFCCASCYAKYSRELLIGVEAAGNIETDTSMIGDGSLVSPLGVKISTDAGNDISPGTDGGLYAINPDVAGGAIDYQNYAEAIFDGEILSLIGHSREVSQVGIIITNPSLTNSMVCFVTHLTRMQGTANAAQGIILVNSIDPGTGVYDDESVIYGMNAGFHGQAFTRVQLVQLLPNESKTLRVRTQCTKYETDGDTFTFTTEPAVSSEIVLLGVPV